MPSGVPGFWGKKRTTGGGSQGLASASCIVERKARPSLRSWKLQDRRQKTNDNHNPQAQRGESQTLPATADTAGHPHETGKCEAQGSAALAEEKEGSRQRPPIRRRTLQSSRPMRRRIFGSPDDHAGPGGLAQAREVGGAVADGGGGGGGGKGSRAGAPVTGP